MMESMMKNERSYELMNEKPYVYMIDEDTYERIVKERVHLYDGIRQLVYIARQPQRPENYTQLRKAAILYGIMAEEMFKKWNIPESYISYENPADLEAIKAAELLDYGDFDTEDITPEDEECVSFFDVMGELIAKSKAVTADMEAVLAELDGELAAFRHDGNDE